MLPRCLLMIINCKVIQGLGTRSTDTATFFSKKEEIMAQKKVTKKATKKSFGKGVKKGEAYKCSVCGLSVVVDEVCGCIDTCDIICCEKPMKPKSKAA